MIQTKNDSEKEQGYQFTDASLIPDDVDCILVIGGDGTIIQAAGDVVGKNIPLLGINMGTLGYLAEVDKKNIFSALDCLLKGEYEIEERMMLEGVVYRNGEEIYRGVALNDIVMNRTGNLRVIPFDIFVNGQLLNSYKADGIIVSTPTGSTGYSLSAGGPIISPNARLMELTPICPHTLNKRSIILDPDDMVEIRISKKQMEKPVMEAVTFDGDRTIQAGERDCIQITRAKQSTKMIKLSRVSFFETLQKKMRG